MKRKLIIFPIIFVLLVFVLFVSFNYFTKKPADWKFVQRVGGIKTGTPLETEDGFYLPVICNVSGTDSVTIRPTLLNSALVCTKIKTKINGNRISLTVILGVASLNSGNCNCRAVNLGKLEAGDYIIYYNDNSSDEHQIGQFALK